jgi:hypothetical protein
MGAVKDRFAFFVSRWGFEIGSLLWDERRDLNAKRQTRNAKR